MTSISKSAPIQQTNLETAFVIAMAPDFVIAMAPDFVIATEPDFVIATAPDFVNAMAPDFVNAMAPDFVIVVTSDFVIPDLIRDPRSPGLMDCGSEPAMTRFFYDRGNKWKISPA